jgi:uncharacterized protein (DUF1501 family)
MNDVARRTFLKRMGLGAGAVMAPGVLGACTWPWRERSEEEIRWLADRGPETGNILVAINLPGGNDGLDTVVPFGRRGYARLRGHLAHRPERLLHLDKEFGLHPALPGLKRLWSAGQLAIVHGVHYDRPDLSHFRCNDVWSSGTTDTEVRSGWLGRSLDLLATRDANPLWGIAVGTSVPPIMAGDVHTAAAVPVFPTGLLWETETRIEQGDLIAAAGELAGGDPEYREAGRLVGEGQRLALAMTERVAPLMLELESDDLAAQLRLVARFVKAGVGTRVYHVAHTGDFDLHANQQSSQAALLAELDQAISRFFADLGPDARHVIVATWSEFGRRPEPNGSGTDHGTASMQFVIGPAVNGGHYGEPPDLERLDENGNLKSTTDFRVLPATLLERWVGVDPAAVLPGVSGRLPLVKA